MRTWRSTTTETACLGIHKKTNLAKYKNNDGAPPAKRLRRSSSVFDFKLHCLYCGKACEINKDPKNPQRWRPAFLCRSTHTEYGGKPYKEYLLEKCNSRNDHWANEVQSRIEGAVSDLHAVDARYHKDCMSLFSLEVTLCQWRLIVVSSSSARTWKQRRRRRIPWLFNKWQRWRLRKCLWLQTTLTSLFFCFTSVAKVAYQLQPLSWWFRQFMVVQWLISMPPLTSIVKSSQTC